MPRIQWLVLVKTPNLPFSATKGNARGVRRSQAMPRFPANLSVARVRRLRENWDSRRGRKLPQNRPRGRLAACEHCLRVGKGRTKSHDATHWRAQPSFSFDADSRTLLDR